ncbi:MAG: hypothetical protein GDA52_01030 [Rhodobacteraceae bacterium]|nr:hypothetical protein [Paracoccaceae bacterium]
MKRTLIAALAMIAALSKPVLAWEVDIETSLMDDSTNVFMYVVADEPNLSAQPGPYYTPELWIRCLEGVTEIFVVFGGHDMAGYGENPVIYRIGAEAAQQTTRSALDTSHEALSLEDVTGSGLNFVKSLLGHDRFVIQATPSGEIPIRATFDTTGIDQAIIPLRESCGW